MNALRTPTFKGKKAVIILSWLALVFTVLSRVFAWIHIYRWNMGYYYYDAMDFATSLIKDLLFVIAPYILFALYITLFHKKGKTVFLLSIIFGLLAIDAMLYIYMNWIYLASAVLWLIVAIVILIRQYNKVLMMAAVVGGLAVESWSIWNAVINLRWGYGIAIINISGIIGALCLYAALIIFALMAITKVTTEEQELKSLQDQLARGQITNEEYQAKRADIISRL